MKEAKALLHPSLERPQRLSSIPLFLFAVAISITGMLRRRDQAAASFAKRCMLSELTVIPARLKRYRMYDEISSSCDDTMS